MILPSLPYRTSKVQRQITQFLGLNLSENTTAGEMRDAYGITTANYPCITQRQSRKALDGYNSPSDIFEWDGKLVVIDGGILYYDGVPLDNVSAGKKQFAVVNSQIVVMPDKICISTVDGTFRRLGSSTITADVAGSVSFTTNSITAALSPVIKGGVESDRYRDVLEDNPGEDETISVIYSYGTDTDKIRACWDSENKTWKDTDALEELKTAHWEMVSGVTSSCLKIGDIVILQRTNNGFKLVSGISTPSGSISPDGALPDKSLYNNEGYYGVITGYGEYGNFERVADWYIIETSWKFDVYNAEKESALLSASFAVGDYVDISGTGNGVNDVSHKKIIAIDDETNTLTFEDGTFAAMAYYYCSEALVSDKIALKVVIDGATYYYHATITAAAGDYLYLVSDTKMIVYRPSTGEKVEGYTTAQKTTKTSGYSTITAIAQSSVTISVPFPKLDYICSSDNRLWGVSNADNTIYASSLGLPNDFYSYDGLSTDSYAVAVGSDGDFTAICAYGDAVLCWKEDCLHKVLGDYPAEYYINEYKIAGVQKGSSRSLAIINDTLYYKGVFGVYAFAGSVPSLVSYNLGNGVFTDGTGGGHNNRYYLSVLDESVNPMLLVYDLLHGLWMKEDNVYADAFATVNSVLYMLSDGTLYEVGAGDESVSWMAEFVPFDETSHARKGYTRLLLRLDMGAKSHMRIEVKEDRSVWREVFTRTATDEMTLSVPLRIGRCDRFAVRLSGKGEVTVRSMAREFFAGSEV